MRRIKTTLLALAAILLAACNGIDRPYEGTYEKVLVYVGLGYNNLSSNLLKNFADMQEGVLPGVASNCAIVAFCHNTASSGDYATACPPQLIRDPEVQRALQHEVLHELSDDMQTVGGASSVRLIRFISWGTSLSPFRFCHNYLLFFFIRFRPAFAPIM